MTHGHPEYTSAEQENEESVIIQRPPKASSGFPSPPSPINNLRNTFFSSPFFTVQFHTRNAPGQPWHGAGRVAQAVAPSCAASRPATRCTYAACRGIAVQHLQRHELADGVEVLEDGHEGLVRVGGARRQHAGIDAGQEVLAVARLGPQDLGAQVVGRVVCRGWPGPALAPGRAGAARGTRTWRRPGRRLGMPSTSGARASELLMCANA